MKALSALIRLLIALPFGLGVILFAVANRGDIVVSLSPLPGSLQLPLAALVLGMGLVGFLFGGLVVWMSQGRHRRLSRDARRRLDSLSAELGALKAARAAPAHASTQISTQLTPPPPAAATPPGTSLIAH